MWPFLKCKDAAAAIIAREDRPLAPSEVLGLKIHLMICKACPNFEQQIVTMRQVMTAWTAHDAEVSDTLTPADTRKPPL